MEDHLPQPDSRTENILIIGATSAIAKATARLYARRGARIHLIARNVEALQAVASDLQVRGATQVSTGVLDVNDFDRHQEAIHQAVSR